MSLVSIHQLSKYFGDFCAVDQLSFQVQKNEVFGLLGLNGAGKSTTLRCMLSLAKPDGGDIQLFGKSLNLHRETILSKIGCLIERPDHYGYLTAAENLRLHVRYYNKAMSTSKMNELLSLVGLHGKENQKVKTFSQGMKQRLAIAAVLAHDPELIILDEPTNGLDPQGIIDLRNLILRLKNEFHKTVIFSSHLLSEVEEVADTMAIIHHGKLMVAGKTAELLSDQEKTVTIETTDAEKLMTHLSLTPWAARCQIKNEVSFQVQCHQDEIMELNRTIIESGLPIYQLQSRKKLEDYFITLTQQHG